MLKKIIYGILFSVCSTCAHAEVAAPSQWQFSWTGFSIWPDINYPNLTFNGTFSGNDANHDGKIELGELSELTIGDNTLTNCGNSASYICSIDAFSYVLGGKLNLNATHKTYFGLPGTDGWSSKSITYIAGNTIQVVDNAQHFYSEVDYMFTPDTVVSIIPVLAPVPEPGSLAMLMAGVFMLSSTLRRKQRKGSAAADV